MTTPTEPAVNVTTPSEQTLRAELSIQDQLRVVFDHLIDDMEPDLADTAERAADAIDALETEVTLLKERLAALADAQPEVEREPDAWLREVSGDGNQWEPYDSYLKKPLKALSGQRIKFRDTPLYRGRAPSGREPHE